VEPIPETREALRRLAQVGDEQLADDLGEAATALRARVPGLVGLSITVVEQGITFTYLTSDLSLSRLDAMQYLGGGPCEDAISTARTVEVDHGGLLDEGRWAFFARASTSLGVASTLSLPILDEGHVVGSVNVYGADPDTFHGRHEELAELFGAWAPGAVTNADLAFSTRLDGARAVSRLEDLAVIDLAVGMLVAANAVSPVDARELLEQAAVRADVTLVEVAHLLVTSGTRR
jgi:GAF domain-containing protein